MKTLVIVMAGDSSLHEKFAPGRKFELWVCYWGDDDTVAARYERSCDRLFRIKGQKWALVREIGKQARTLALPQFSSYDYVFLPDDDIEFPNGAADIERAFEFASEIKADIYQPAVANENLTKEATRRIEGAVCHAATSVEIMMPCFTGEVFEQSVLRLLHVNGYVKVGWGLELLFVRMAESFLNRPVRTFVLDDVPAIHTRPVRSGPSAYAVGENENFISPVHEACPMRELARFTTRDAATTFEFPMSDSYVDWARVDRKMDDISNARMLLKASRKKTIRAKLIAWVMLGSRRG
jgi:hypothetical protein